MRNKMAKLITPMESRPVNWVNNPTSSGPITAANLPKISKNPKYSLERSGGISLPKYERGQRLDAALNRPHQEGHAPEQHLGKSQCAGAFGVLLNVEAHKEAHHSDTEIDAHRAAQQVDGPHLPRQLTEDDGERHGHNLGGQQSQDHAHRVQAQLGAIGSGHGDNGIDTIDVEKVGNDEQEHPVCG